VRPERYECEICSGSFGGKCIGEPTESVRFTTNLGAMARHQEAHQSDDFIVIGKIRNGKNAGKLRPEQHYFCEEVGRYTIGPEAKPSYFFLPETTKIDGEMIYCRSCSKYKAPWNEISMSANQLTRSIN